jgi:hypothetical protein
MLCAIGESLEKMFDKTTVKLKLPTNLNIFDNLKEKSDYFSDLAFKEVKKDADKRIDEYNKLSWWSKFWNKKVIKESFYLGIGKAYRYNRICSTDCILAIKDMLLADVHGMYYLSLAELALKTNGTIVFCRENGVGSIEIEDSDVQLLNRIEKEYSKR